MKKIILSVVLLTLAMLIVLPMAACKQGDTPGPETTGNTLDTGKTESSEPAEDTEPTTPGETDTQAPPVEDIELDFADELVWLKVGETYEITGSIPTDPHAVITVEGIGCDGASVLTLSGHTLQAIGAGSVLVCAANAYTGKSDTLSIRVFDPQKEPFAVITAPVWGVDFLTDQSMEYLRDAGFTHISLMDGAQTDEEVKYALEQGAKFGIKVFPSLSTPTVHETSMTKSQIQARYDMFKEYKAFDGFHMKDEPANGFGAYARVAQTLYEIDPTMVNMINFLPNANYDRVYDYAAQLHDNDYKGVISLDNYVFGLAHGSVDEYWLFRNFEMYRDIGIKNRVRTAFYVQAIGMDGGYRRPGAGELRYHSMLSLAYGFTSMRYFSYVTPAGNPEFTNGIMDRDFQPTDLYPISAEINKTYRIFVEVLANANTTQIYHTGNKLNKDADYELIPETYFITPVNSKDRSVLSVFTDRLTGENYLMVVNKDFAKEQTYTYRLDGVTSLYEVDKETGMLVSVDVSKGELTCDLTAGDARLYLLPKGVFNPAPKEPAENLLHGAYTTVSSSAEMTGYGVAYLSDGNAMNGGQSFGWCSNAYRGEDTWILYDLDEAKTFDRLDMYPVVLGFTVGQYFPKAFEVQTSDDGVTFKTIASYRQSGELTEAASLTFDPTTARYVRVRITDMEGGRAEISEIALFADGGKVEPPQSLPSPDDVPTLPAAPEDKALVLDITNFSQVFGTVAVEEQNFGALSRNSGFAYVVNVPVSGTYSLTFTASCDSANTGIIDIYAIHDETVDFSGLPQNKLVGSFQTHQSTGGWFNFIDFEPVLVYLEAGEQWLVFCSPTPVDIMNVASIRVDYVSDKKPEPPEETEPTPIVIPTTPEEPAAVLDTTNHADLFGSTESYSSTTYVSHFGNLAAGSGFSYFLNIPADGTYSLTFYVSTPHSEYVDDLAIYAIHGDSVDYANLKNSDRVGIFFNDQNTGGWTNFVATTPVEVYLKAGEQYLVIKSMSSHAGYINVSKLELAYVSDEKPADSTIVLPSQTDDTVLLNNKNATIFLGNVKVEEQNFGELTAGAGFGYEIKVEAERQYELTFRVATPGADPSGYLEIYLAGPDDGDSIESAALIGEFTNDKGTADWMTFDTATPITVTIPAGHHGLVFYVASGTACMNVADVTVRAK